MTSDLKNTKSIVKIGYLQLLDKAANFSNDKKDLKSIYITFIISEIEQLAVVWHSSLTKKDRKDL